MAVGQFRARSGTEIVDAAFQLVKSNYAAMVTITAIGCVPALLAELITPDGMDNGSTISKVVAGVLYLLYFLTVLIMQSALIRAASDAYLGKPIDIAASLKAGKQSMATLFVTNLAVGIVTAFAALLFIVPGLIVFAWFFVAPAVIVLEGVNAEKALNRSRELCKDTKLRIWGFLLVVGIAFIIGSAISGVIFLTTKTFLALQVSNLICMILIWPLYPAFMVVQYYDARIRKEGFDVELMAQSMSPNTSPTTPAPQTA